MDQKGRKTLGGETKIRSPDQQVKVENGGAVLMRDEIKLLKIWAAEVMIYGEDFTQWTETT